ncbi:MAG: hypothetical protein H0T73_13820, partial [Ardenticatenales bacterium]|nr:hypothetical protein [Ardenticatenales bacterium]
VVQRQGELAARSITVKQTPKGISFKAKVGTMENTTTVQVRFEVYKENTLIYSYITTQYKVMKARNAKENSIDMDKELWLPSSPGTYEVRMTVDPNNRYTEPDEMNNTVSQMFTVSDKVALAPQLQGSPRDRQQWFAESTIPLEIAQESTLARVNRSAPVEFLSIQTYQYEQDEAESGVLFPVKVAEQRLPVTSLANVSLTLAPQVKAGPVVLHVWALAGNVPSAEPLIITFNYIPPQTPITSDTVHYYLFEGQVGDKLAFTHKVDPTNSTRLFLWYPDNAGKANQRSPLAGSVTLSVPHAPAGSYVLAVQGDPQASSTYTLNLSSAPGGGEGSEELRTRAASSSAEPQRPIFLAPDEEHPETLYQVFMPFLNPYPIDQ